MNPQAIIARAGVGAAAVDLGSIIGIVGTVITTIIAVYAIRDVRERVRVLISLERKRIYTRVRNDLVWLFIEPTEHAYPPEIARGFEEFAVVSQALNPKHTPELTKYAVENETLMFAEKLVNGGLAKWKAGWNEQEVKKTIHNWQTAINANRMDNILGKEWGSK